MELLNRSVLCLNASYEAINIITAKRALSLILKGKAEVMERSDLFIRAGRAKFHLPDVIKFREYRKVPRPTRSVSRKGILLRDCFTCQYCSKKFPAGSLTLDHVVPKVKGGQSTWTNLVSACFHCNQKKGARTPTEAGMIILQKPIQMSVHAKHRLLRGNDNHSWDAYLF